MPKFKITDPQSGKTVTVSGSNAPTQQDAEEIFQKAGLRDSSAFSNTGENATVAPGTEKGFMGGFLQRAISGIVANSKSGQGAVRAQNAEVETVKKFFERALAETDPEKKKQLIAFANDAQARLQSNLTGRKEQQLGNIGWSNEEANKYSKQGRLNDSVIKDSVQGAIDLGTTIATPALKPFKGAGALTRVANAAVTGAAAGGLYGTGRAVQADSLGEAATDIGTGALTGGVVGGVAQTGIEAIKGILGSRLVNTVVKSGKNIFGGAKSLMGGDPKSSINEAIGLNSGSINKYYKTKNGGKDVADNLLEYADEIFTDGKGRFVQTTDDIATNVSRAKANTGTAIETALSKEPTINLNQLDKKIKEAAIKLKRLGKADQAEKTLSYWDDIKNGNLQDPLTGKFRNKGELSALESWRLKSEIQSTLYTQTGKATNVTPLSPAEKQVREELAGFLGQSIKTNETTKKLFSKYETLIAAEKALESKLGKVQGKAQPPSSLGMAKEGLFAGTRDPNVLARDATAKPGMLSNIAEKIKSASATLSKKTTPVIKGLGERTNNYTSPVVGAYLSQNAMDRASQKR